jgi:hypothetical protein
MNSRALKAIVYGGLVAGTLDIGVAALSFFASPIVILRVVATGVLGKASYTGGATSAALGMILQWAMSLLIAAIFVVPAMRYRVLVRRWVASGLAYGVVIFFVMNYVVVPLSQSPPRSGFSTYSFTVNMLAMLLFGLIIAYFANFFLAARTRER